MPKNNRLPATVTRSLSFRFDLLAAIDTRVEELRSDRSTFINGVMEHVLGLHPHPEFVGRNTPFVIDRDHRWSKLAKELELEANQGRETKRLHKASKAAAKPGGLVKRPR